MSGQLLRRWPFLTGSRCYGTPTEESDTDIVMLISDQYMWESIVQGLEKSGSSDLSVVIGELNIIPVFSNAEYDGWRAATKKLRSYKEQGWTIPRDAAITVIDEELLLRGIDRTKPLVEPFDDDDCPF